MRASLFFSMAMMAAAWAEGPMLDRPQHVLVEKGQVCALTPENMLRRNEKVSSYENTVKLGTDASFGVTRPGKGNPQAFFLRHPIRIAPLTSYEVSGQIFVEQMEGDTTVLQVELLDGNREEFTSEDFKLARIPELKKWTPFSFSFSSKRQTPYLRMWIVTTNRTRAKFYLDDLKLTQVSAPRAQEVPPVKVLEQGGADPLEGELPPGSSYLQVSVTTEGRSAPDDALKVDLAGGKDEVRYVLRWTGVKEVSGEDKGIAGTWFEPTRKGLEDVSFAREVKNGDGIWTQELAIPAGAKSIRVTPSTSGMKVKKVVATVRKDPPTP